jgi:hypothetical protein
MSLTVFEADAKAPKLSRLECNQVGRAEASATVTGKSKSGTWREHVGVLRIAEWDVTFKHRTPYTVLRNMGEKESLIKRQRDEGRGSNLSYKRHKY